MKLNGNIPRVSLSWNNTLVTWVVRLHTAGGTLMVDHGYVIWDSRLTSLMLIILCFLCLTWAW